jgi:hypothetical protein
MLGQAVARSTPDANGALVALPRPGARATVVDFWATDCVPCKRSVPRLAAHATELKSDDIDVVFVGVLRDGESASDATAIFRSWGVFRPFLVDRGGALQNECRIDALPATLVLDGRGVVRWVAPADAQPGTIVDAARAVASR